MRICVTENNLNLLICQIKPDEGVALLHPILKLLVKYMLSILSNMVKALVE